MTTKYCTHCGHPFEPRPQVPDQAFCSAPECQRARKREWQRAKLQSDPDYRINQQAAQRAWSQRNHDYWRNHRDAQQVNGDQGERVMQRAGQKSDKPIDLFKIKSKDKGKPEHEARLAAYGALVVTQQRAGLYSMPCAAAVLA